MRWPRPIMIESNPIIRWSRPIMIESNPIMMWSRPTMIESNPIIRWSLPEVWSPKTPGAQAKSRLPAKKDVFSASGFPLVDARAPERVRIPFSAVCCRIPNLKPDADGAGAIIPRIPDLWETVPWPVPSLSGPAF